MIMAGLAILGFSRIPTDVRASSKLVIPTAAERSEKEDGYDVAA
jgi:hypothetical protein